MGGAGSAFGDTEVDDVLGCVGRDPFAEEDGGAPLEPGRVATAATAGTGAAASGSGFRKGSAASVDGATTAPKGRMERRGSTSRGIAGGVAPGRPAVSVLEDLWKMDPRTLLWERVRADLGGNATQSFSCFAREA